MLSRYTGAEMTVVLLQGWFVFFIMSITKVLALNKQRQFMATTPPVRILKQSAGEKVIFSAFIYCDTFISLVISLMTYSSY